MGQLAAEVGDLFGVSPLSFFLSALTAVLFLSAGLRSRRLLADIGESRFGLLVLVSCAALAAKELSSLLQLGQLGDAFALAVLASLGLLALRLLRMRPLFRLMGVMIERELRDSPTAMALLGEDGSVLFANGVARSLLGLEPGGRVPEGFGEDLLWSLEMARGGTSVPPLELCGRGEASKVRFKVRLLPASDADRRGVLLIGEDVSAEAEMIRRVASERDRFERYFQLSQTLNLIIGPHLRIKAANERLCELLGATPSELKGKRWTELLPPGRRGDYMEALRSAFKTNSDSFDSLTLPLSTPRGERLVRWKVGLIRGGDGRPVEFIASGLDVTEEALKQRRLELYQRVYSGLVEASKCVLKSDFTPLVLERFLKGLCCDLEEVSWCGFLLREDHRLYLRQAWSSSPTLREGLFLYEEEIPKEHTLVEEGEEGLGRLLKELPPPGGKALVIPIRAEERTIAALIAKGRMEASADLMAIAGLIEEHLELLYVKASREKEIRRLATFDHLTGLLNRRSLEEMASRKIKEALASGRSLSLAYFDLDGFKRVNDELGHEAGDEILRLVASTLRQNCREGDFLARMGGDEFVLLMPGSSMNEAHKVASRLQRALENASFPVGGLNVRLSMSFGLASLPEDGGSFEDLVARADLRMLRNKKRRRGA